jgi:hypothetical protein
MALWREIRSLLLIIVLGLAGYLVLTNRPALSEQPGPTVVLYGDSGDNAKLECDNAKKRLAEDKDLINRFGCEAVMSCSLYRPRYTACMNAHDDPKAWVRHFADDLMTQFAINSNCKGAAFARGYASAPYWLLTIDYDLGAATQNSSLLPPTGDPYRADGNTPAKIAADVCAIVMGHGGTLLK